MVFLSERRIVRTEVRQSEAPFAGAGYRYVEDEEKFRFFAGSAAPI
jgi:hypothetical protein